jgi:isopentenyl-diphosphate delta-isomerase
MDQEPIETYDEQGQRLGIFPRGQVHADGLWHRAANILLFRSNGALILQKRAADKDVCPDLWDLSVAEHLSPGESFLDAAHRGLAEELGLNGIDLTPIGQVLKARYVHADICDREFQQSFKGVTDEDLKPDPAEVAKVREITLSELQTAIQDQPVLFTPWFKHVLEFLRYI